MDTYHEMDGYREGRVIIWNCPICGRQVLSVHPLKPVVVEPGDANMTHRGGIGGLTVGTATIEETPDPFDTLRAGPFEQWAGENAERLFESDPDRTLPPPLDS